MSINANSLFETYLKNQAFHYKKVDDMKEIEGKRPDFIVEKDGMLVFVEVKEIEPEEWETKQIKLQEKLNSAFSQLKLGASFSSFADDPSNQEIRFFANFLKRLENNEVLAVDIPLYIVMPNYDACLKTRGAIVVISLLDKNKTKKQIIISPETSSSKYPILTSYIDHRWIEYAEINGNVNDFIEASQGKPAIVLKKNSIGGSIILPIILGGSFDKSNQIREKIRKASDNLGSYKDKGPCVLALYTKSQIGIFEFELFNAIGGTEKISFPIPRDGEEVKDEDIKTIREKDGQLVPKKNTRFSVISILRHSSKGLFLETYHNPFAAKPLPKDFFSAARDKVYYFDKEGRKQEYKKD